MEKLCRNKQHFIIMTIIYNEINDLYNGKEEIVRDASQLISDTMETPYSEVSQYIKDNVMYSLSHYKEIVSFFSPFLKQWSWTRLPLLTQAILIMSYSHFKIEKVDKKIVINIAVELAKTYIEEKQANFINAILDEAYK